MHLRSKMILAFFLLFFLSFCKNDSEENMTISFENMNIATADLVYVRSTCLFEGTPYKGFYSYIQRTFNFDSINACINVIGNNLDLENCSGSLSAKCDDIDLSCNLLKDGDNCLCSYEDADTNIEKDAKDKLSEGIMMLIDKISNAREFVFLGSNVCREEAEEPYTNYICSCDLL
jgi:hypothetical protein